MGQIKTIFQIKCCYQTSTDELRYSNLLKATTDFSYRLGMHTKLSKRGFSSSDLLKKTAGRMDGWMDDGWLDKE